jgi:hypothetical protein
VFRHVVVVSFEVIVYIVMCHLFHFEVIVYFAMWWLHWKVINKLEQRVAISSVLFVCEFILAIA